MKRLIVAWSFAVLLLTAFLVFSFIRGERQLETHFIDAGYSDAILIKLPDKQNLLIDAGDKEHGAKILDHLKNIGVRKIDCLFLTHPHKNHFGSLPILINSIPISRIFTNGEIRGEEGFEDILKMIREKQIPVQILKRGDSLDNLKIEVLNPSSIDLDQNASSLVLKLTYRKTSFLFTSDIPSGKQEELIQIYGNKLRSGCILLPHHGGPISKRFADFLNPAIFIASTGPNQWNLPRQDELNRLKGKVYRTDINGTVIVSSDGQKLNVRTER